MREIIKANNKLSGRCSFRVVGVPEKVPAGKTTVRVWSLQSLEHDEMLPIRYRVVPWEAKGICLITGGTLADNGDVEWDDETVDGKCFSAEVSYVDQFGGKLNPKTNKPYQNMVLSNFEEVTPF